MPQQYVQWDDTFSADLSGLSSATVTAGTEQKAGSAVSNDEKWVTEVAVEVSYPATAPDSAELRIYGATADAGFASQPTAVFPIPATASTVQTQRFTIQASVSEFEVAIFNPSTNGGVTATVRTRQGTLEST
jgi:Tfp pilus assembly protein PilW